MIVWLLALSLTCWGLLSQQEQRSAAVSTRATNIIMGFADMQYNETYIMCVVCSWAMHASDESELHVFVPSTHLAYFRDVFGASYCGRPTLYFIPIKKQEVEARIFADGYHFARTAVPVVSRNYHYYVHLRELMAARPRSIDLKNVMVLDLKDSLIQGDPFTIFAAMPADTLAISVENILYGHHKDNDDWIRILYGEEKLQSLIRRKELIINAGLTAGSAVVMRSYLQHMLREIKPGIDYHYGLDQGIHNKVVRERSFNVNRQLCESGRLTSVAFFTRGGFAAPGMYTWSAGKLLRTWKSHADYPAVVHQYPHLHDRLPDLMREFYTHYYKSGRVLAQESLVMIG